MDGWYNSDTTTTNSSPNSILLASFPSGLPLQLLELVRHKRKKGEHVFFLSCLLHYYGGVEKEAHGSGRPVSSFFPASYIIIEE